MQTNGEDVMADYQYNQEVRACIRQNDGIFLIPADGEPMIEGNSSAQSASCGCFRA